MIAHRGESYLAPENTLAAINLAWSKGVKAVEFDLRLTADDRLVGSHDATTQRASNQSLVIREEPLERLVQLDVGRWKGRQWAGQRMPTFEQILVTAPEDGRVFIEIKDGPEAVGPMVEVIRAGSVDVAQCVVISFHRSVIERVKRELPDVEACWLLNPSSKAQSGEPTMTLDQIIATAESLGADGVDLKATERVDAAFIHAVRDAGLKAYVWTVDDPAHARRLFEARIDDVTTNRAAWMKAQLEGE